MKGTFHAQYTFSASFTVFKVLNNISEYITVIMLFGVHILTFNSVFSLCMQLYVTKAVLNLTFHFAATLKHVVCNKVKVKFPHCLCTLSPLLHCHHPGKDSQYCQTSMTTRKLLLVNVFHCQRKS